MGVAREICGGWGRVYYEGEEITAVFVVDNDCQKRNLIGTDRSCEVCQSLSELVANNNTRVLTTYKL
jgi:hypothetical protein